MSSERGSVASVRSIALQHGLFAFVPAVLTAYLVYASIQLGNFAFDFHHAYWAAGRATLAGRSPFVDPSDPTVASNLAFIYPAVGALVVAPFALLPHGAADVAFTLVSFGSLFAALRLLEVRDWRVYGLVLLWLPTIHAWQNANVTLPLVAGTAAVWRYRDTPPLAGSILALLVSAKLVLWPLAVWLLAARRTAALGYAVAVGLALNGAAWAVVGFGELSRYEHLLARIDTIETPRSYSVAALLMRTGMSSPAAHWASYALGGLLLAACAACCLRGQERRALAIAVAATLVASPVLWTHYLCFLAVPLAVMRPRLGALWFMPLFTVVCPEAGPSAWRQLVALAVAAVVLGVLVWRPTPRATARHIPPSPVRWAATLRVDGSGI